MKVNVEWLGFTLARLIASAALVWAILPNPIGYYSLLGFLVCTVCLYGVYRAVKLGKTAWAFPFGALAFLFNPFVRVALQREMWAYVDLATAAFLVLTIVLFRDKTPNPS